MSSSHITSFLRARFFNLYTFRILSLVIFGIVLFLTPQVVHALDVTLAWNENGEQDLAGYRVFFREEGRSYNYDDPVWKGTDITCTIHNLDIATTYCFVVRAFDKAGYESGDSAEVCYAPPENVAPTAGKQWITTLEDTPVNITLTATDNDEDPLTYTVVSQPSHGTLSGTAPKLAYLPETNYHGFDTFTFKAHDGTTDSNTATVTIIVNRVNDVPPIEIGEVGVGHDWKWVELSENFQDPIVVAKSLSSNDGEPAVVRIGHVYATGFEIRVQEWDYLDGIHTEETIGYIVMERGTYTLPDGTMVEAGRFETDMTDSFENIDFSQAFQVAPVVITAVSSDNGPDAVTTRVRNISTNGFELKMQEQEFNTQSHTTETISYIAWEPSSGTVDGLTFEVNKTDDKINHKLQTIVYNGTFMNAPVFLADMQTTDGGDTANVRWQDKDPYGVDVKIVEEQSGDSETSHTTEVVGYMLFLRTRS
ncbi:MAG: hypothetical protein BA873_07935 [Desulfobulbaceae bacterium C00003063]|nr:MAG: hypothetical protein BA873_07935 [Desulfobulbaceae bacterium C00003063]